MGSKIYHYLALQRGGCLHQIPLMSLPPTTPCDLGRPPPWCWARWQTSVSVTWVRVNLDGTLLTVLDPSTLVPLVPCLAAGASSHAVVSLVLVSLASLGPAYLVLLYRLTSWFHVLSLPGLLNASLTVPYVP